VGKAALSAKGKVTATQDEPQTLKKTLKPNKMDSSFFLVQMKGATQQVINRYFSADNKKNKRVC